MENKDKKTYTIEEITSIVNSKIESKVRDVIYELKERVESLEANRVFDHRQQRAVFGSISTLEDLTLGLNRRIAKLENKSSKMAYDQVYEIPNGMIGEFEINRSSEMSQSEFVKKWISFSRSSSTKKIAELEAVQALNEYHDATYPPRPKLKEFDKLADSLVKWLNDNHDPHTMIIIRPDRAVLLREEMGVPNEKHFLD